MIDFARYHVRERGKECEHRSGSELMIDALMAARYALKLNVIISEWNVRLKSKPSRHHYHNPLVAWAALKARRRNRCASEFVGVDNVDPDIDSASNSFPLPFDQCVPVWANLFCSPNLRSISATPPWPSISDRVS